MPRKQAKQAKQNKQAKQVKLNEQRGGRHLDKAQLDEEWTTNGKEAIWVGRSDQISQGHINVPG